MAMTTEEETTSAKRKERFNRVAVARVNRILAHLDKLNSCTAPHLYGYTPGQVDQVFGALHSKLDAVHRNFKGLGTPEFVLDPEA